MAKITIVTCDRCGKKMDDQPAAVLMLKWNGRRGMGARPKEIAELCNDCATAIPQLLAP